MARAEVMALSVGVCLMVLQPGSCVRMQQRGAPDDIMMQQSRASEAIPYFWTSGRGKVGSYSRSLFEGPKNISKPTWTWYDPKGKWANTPQGVAIDEHKNIYLTLTDGIRKFTPDGKELWSYERRTSGPDAYENIHKTAAMMDGALYGISMQGRAFAVSMETGKELWSTKVSSTGSDGNNGHVVAHGGVVITAAEVSNFVNRSAPLCCGPSNHDVVGLNGSDGSILWKYTPQIPIWNFGASFAGDGTFIFQDFEGRVHRNRVRDGSLIWKAGGEPGTWTDGQANLGFNGIVYGVANRHNGFGPGHISAYRLSDGEMLWRQELKKAPNSLPAVGLLAGRTSPSVVIPVGENDRIMAQINVVALDAATGQQQWEFKGPRQTTPCGVGDAKPEARLGRKMNKISEITLPNSWGIAGIDGSGAVYVGGTTGHFFRLCDVNMDGKVAGHEVSTLATESEFVGCSGPAFAPGLMAVGNANQMMVWQF